MKRSVLCFICCLSLLLTKPGLTQNDSLCNLRISVLTCSPGQELYSLFGHSALRIIDQSKQTDIIYNWGTFGGYGEPDFYLNFMRGKLPYYVSPDKLNDFMYEYEFDGRSVTEQVLALTCEDKFRIKQAVDSNMIPANRYYKYDFIFDNCTSRIRDLLQQNTRGLKMPDRIVEDGTTFRNMIHSYLDKGSQPWSKLGIDILLGARIDRAATTSEAMFLPEYLMKAIDSSLDKNKPLVENKRPLILAQPYEEMSGKYEPLLYFSIFCFILLIVNLQKTAWANRFTRIADNFLLYLTGLLGLLLLFMWFFTDHIATANNYNLAWALPTNFIVAFFAWKKPSWAKQYFKAAASITVLLLLGWFWMPQQMNIALLPFTLYMLYRYVKLSNG